MWIRLSHPLQQVHKFGGDLIQIAGGAGFNQHGGKHRLGERTEPFANHQLLNPFTGQVSGATGVDSRTYCTDSFSALPALKAGTLAAAMVIGSPV